MKKVYWKRAIKFAALMVPVVLSVLFLQKYVFVYCDVNTERIEKFYAEEKDSLDVVFIGASEVHAGYSPGYAYDKYGYTSYMYTMDGNIGSLYKAQLNEILSQQSPEVIFVEAYGFIVPEEALDDEDQLRIFVESIPGSENKWNTIMEFHYDNKLSCLFPFIKYHGDVYVAKNRVSYLYDNRKNMASPLLLKGKMTQTEIFDGPGDLAVANENNSHINAGCEAYLRELLQYCREKNLKNVVFLNFPRYFQNENNNDLLSRVENVRQIVESYGFDFIDLHQEKEQIGLDHGTDFYNSHHLNVYGQQKVTDYLGSIVMDRYGLVPREQTAENKARWQDSAFFSGVFYEVAQELIAAGENSWLGTDTDLLPYLDPETAERFQAARCR